ncbi:MAG: type II toxin-antitoxin system VapC family toxin [Candidatus Obscuribacterales bacterium]|nr:type II toxin-antitoxin system VapC family toxin [Candidatus Obscuribacterales bacterium]
MTVVVPDACVLIKWVVNESDQIAQLKAGSILQAAIKDELQLKVPSLWLFEVGNTLGRQLPKHAAILIEKLVRFGLDEPLWTTDWLNQTLSISSKYKVTFYDASYHALAITEGGTFVTADLEYARKTKSLGSVIYLNDWQD